MSYRIKDLWPKWQENAHCADQGVEKYFGDDTQQPTMSIAQVRRASKLCDVCPVFRECLRHALTQREEYGVWAGTSGRVRRRLFTLLDNGDATVDEIIEVTINGRGQPASGATPLRGDRGVSRGDGLPDASPGDVAL